MTSLAVRLRSGVTRYQPALDALEAEFKRYLSNTAPIPNLNVIVRALIEQLQLIETAHPIDEDEPAYQDGEVYLTEALVYLIETYGIDCSEHPYQLNPQAIALLKHPRILNLIHANNQQLIYEINLAIEKRESKAHELIEYRRQNDFLKTKFNSQEDAKKLKRSTVSLNRFLYYVQHPLEEEQMHKSLENLIEDCDLDDARTIFYTYKQVGKHHWNFLNTVYGYYNRPLARKGIIRKLRELGKTEQERKEVEILIEDLRLVHKARIQAQNKTESQIKWMGIGGFAYGMEAAMSLLIYIALGTPIGGMGSLGISIAAAILLGRYITLFFISAHNGELTKQNQREAFQTFVHEKYPDTKPQTSWTPNWSKGEWVARLGTAEEGLSVFSLITTLSLFLIDMVSWSIKGGDYTSTFPGEYFFTQILTNCHWGWYIPTVVALGVILYTAYMASTSLASGHYALDGNETIEYYENEDKEQAMRETLNGKPVQPLIFSENLFTKPVFLNNENTFKSRGALPIF
jgi:hypothetical protein